MSIVARQSDMNTNMVFGWRKLYRDAPVSQLVPVIVTPDQPVAAPPPVSNDAIEIELPHGYRVRIGCGVKAAAQFAEPTTSPQLHSRRLGLKASKSLSPCTDEKPAKAENGILRCRVAHRMDTAEPNVCRRGSCADVAGWPSRPEYFP